MAEMIDTHQLTLRLATPADERAVIRLAQRDARWPPPAPFLLGFEGDRLLAAISLADGEVVADPFQRTASVVAMLRTRIGQLSVDRQPSPGILARLRRSAQPSSWRMRGLRVAATSSRRRTGVV